MGPQGLHEALWLVVRSFGKTIDNIIAYMPPILLRPFSLKFLRTSLDFLALRPSFCCIVAFNRCRTDRLQSDCVKLLTQSQGVDLTNLKTGISGVGYF